MLAVHPATASISRPSSPGISWPTIRLRRWWRSWSARSCNRAAICRRVYRALVEAPEAWTAAPVKFKTPWEWAVSAARGGGGHVPGRQCAGLRHPAGPADLAARIAGRFDDIAASWAGPDAVMRRVEAAERFAARARGEQDRRADARHQSVRRWVERKHRDRDRARGKPGAGRGAAARFPRIHAEIG